MSIHDENNSLQPPITPELLGQNVLHIMQHHFLGNIGYMCIVVAESIGKDLKYTYDSSGLA